jgi:hypothetical protein
LVSVSLFLRLLVKVANDLALALSALAAIISLFIENLSHEYTAEIDHPVEKPEVAHKEYA